MRRLRADGPRGSRNRLAAEGILLLSGAYDSALSRALELPHCGPSEFISHTVTVGEETICAAHGWHIVARP